MGSDVATQVAAVAATLLATIGAVPQVRRLLVTGDADGVSACAAGLGVATEVAWIAYTVHGGLWAAVPEACLMLAANVLLLVVLVRAGVEVRRAAVAGTCWLGALGAAAAAGGSSAIAAILAVAYAVQVTPAVWSVYQTSSPSGVARATWAIILGESLLWGVYGIGQGDPANISFGVVGSVAAAAILARTGKMSPCPT